MGNLQIGEQFKVKTDSSNGLSLHKEATTNAITMDGKELNILVRQIPNGEKVTLESVEVKTGDKLRWYNVKYKVHYADKSVDKTGWVVSDSLEALLLKGEQFKVKTASSAGLSLHKEATTTETTMGGKEKNIIRYIPNGAKVTLESVVVKTGDKHTWYSVRYTDKDKKDVTGWVASDSLQELLLEGEQFKVKTGSDGLSLRKEATTTETTMGGKEKNIILSIPNGAKVTLKSGKVLTSDKHTWYNVRHTDKDKKEVTGWVASDYLEFLLSSFPTLSRRALSANLPGEDEYPCTETKGELFSVDSKDVGELNLPKTLREKLPKKLSEKVPEKVSEIEYEKFSEKVSDNLRRKFKEHSITLSPNAMATAIFEGTKWKIVDGNQTYFIMSKDGTKNTTLYAYKPAFANQCAIRMGIALEKSDVDLDSFQGARCWQKHDPPKHILRAQELADWLKTQTKLVGKAKIITKSDKPPYDFKGKQGIVFFQNITGADVEGIDHIDLWNGWVPPGQEGGGTLQNGCEKLHKVSPDKWVEKSGQILFWDLCPCTTKTDALAYSERNINSSNPCPIDPNQPLEVVAVQENWVLVRFGVNGERGWIQRELVLIPDQYLAA